MNCPTCHHDAISVCETDQGYLHQCHDCESSWLVAYQVQLAPFACLVALAAIALVALLFVARSL
jgi:transposase-like protein